MLAGLVLVGLGLWAIFLRVVDDTPYVLALDDLRIPPAWQLERTDRHEAILMGTPITRYYLVPGEAVDVFPSVRAVVTAAGFVVDEERAVDECAADSNPPGPLDCYLAVIRGDVHLWIVVFHRGSVVYSGPGTAAPIGAPDSSVIRIGSGPRY